MKLNSQDIRNIKEFAKESDLKHFKPDQPLENMSKREFKAFYNIAKSVTENIAKKPCDKNIRVPKAESLFGIEKYIVDRTIKKNKNAYNVYLAIEKFISSNEKYIISSKNRKTIVKKAIPFLINNMSEINDYDELYQLTLNEILNDLEERPNKIVRINGKLVELCD